MIFKLSSLFYVINIALYLSYLLVGTIVFATFVFYAENFSTDWGDNASSAFTTITKSMW